MLHGDDDPEDRKEGGEPRKPGGEEKKEGEERKEKKEEKGPERGEEETEDESWEPGAARARLETRRHQRPVVVKGLVPKLRPVEAPPP